MKKETAICKIHKEHNIVHIEFNESAVLKDTNLNEVYEYINDMYGTNQPKLIDVRAPLSIDAKAMQFFNAQNSTNKIANQAILAGKNTTEEILRVFIGMHSEETPFRIFTDYETAVNWLNFKNR